MAYHRLLRAIASQPWAMSAEYVDMMLGILEFRMSNGPLTPEQVEARLNGRREKAVASSAGNIAVIPVRGVIANRMGMLDDVSQVGTSAEGLDRDVRAAYESDEIKAIVLDVNSPGGAVGGIPDLAETLLSLRGGSKPIVAHVNDLAASAAYWIASSVDEVIATPASQIGSIGVITVHEEISRRLEAEGVTETIISAGKYKGEGNWFEPLTDEAREWIQAMVDTYYGMFIKAVADGRGVDEDRVRTSYGEGRTLIARDAQRAGMIDRIGTMRETLQRLGAKSGTSPNRTRAVSPSVPISVRRKRLELECQKARLPARVSGTTTKRKHQ